MLSFKLDENFVNEYRDKPEPFGFSGLGAVTFYRTYSRQKEDGSFESWVDVCTRVIQGMYSIQKDFCLAYGRNWSDKKAQESAQEAFDRMFNFKWTPSGRGLWLLGTEFIHERKVAEALMNCSFISTKDIAEQRGMIFSWFMEMLMLGVGVGGDVRGEDELFIGKPIVYAQTNLNTTVIEDTRESWAESVEILFDSYIYRDRNEYNDFNNKHEMIYFDYSKIRAAGEPIKGFGGVSSGADPLIKLHKRMREYLDKNAGFYITTRTIVDIFNAIGACVVAGNVRRSAEIMFGEFDNEQFANLKNYAENPERSEIGWVSNNSLFASVGSNYSTVAATMMTNGEPGLFWLENAQKYGRMDELKPDNAIGGNPCMEQPLANKESCNLVEAYMQNHTDLYDYLRTLKFAYLYGKTMTLTYDWITDYDSRKIMQQNRRIGLSNTGVAQFLGDNDLQTLIKFWDTGYKYVQHYDAHYSNWLGINKSIRTTTFKPSGTVSLVAGATPGIHRPESEYYIRRIRIQNETNLLRILENCGFRTEPDAYSDNTTCVEFPIHVGNNIQTERETSIWEQLELTALGQKYWADNAVSVTIKFDPKMTTEKEIERALNYYQFRLKGVSFLPQPDEGAYVQMPYEKITKEQYEIMTKYINFEPLGFLAKAMDINNKEYELYCNTDSCILPIKQVS